MSKYVILTAILSVSMLYAAIAYDVSEEARSFNENIAYVNEIPPPDGYKRIEVGSESFGQYLQNLPLKQKNNIVMLYNGYPKWQQAEHYRVIDIDVGNRDLQQCADAMIRLRAEYLYKQGRFDDIVFNFTSGDPAKYSEWIRGYRPIINGNNVRWTRQAEVDSSYSNFRDYLNIVFMYAGTYSLEKEMEKIRNLANVKIGDVFIKGGFPGHGIIIVDMAEDEKTGERIVLLAQSEWPAQEIHILKNWKVKNLSPWFELGDSPEIYTNYWIFRFEDLRAF